MFISFDLERYFEENDSELNEQDDYEDIEENPDCTIQVSFKKNPKYYGLSIFNHI